MISSSIAYVANSPVARALYPVVLSGAKSSLRGAIAGLAGGVIGSAFYAYNRSPNARVARRIIILGVCNWIYLGGMTGACWGLGRALAVSR